MTRPEIEAIEYGSGPSPRRTREGRTWVRGRAASTNSTLPRDRSRGMIRLGEAAPALQVLRARMRARELQLLYGLPEEALVISRVDHLAQKNQTDRRRPS